MNGEPNELPTGWAWSALENVVEVLDHLRQPVSAAERAKRAAIYPYFGANGQAGMIDDFLIDGDHILVAEDGGYFDDPSRGVAYRVRGKAWVNNHAHILRARSEVSTDFLLYALNAVDWMRYVSGTTRLKLTQARLREVLIPIPPLPEQRRIVAKLDELVASSRAGRTALDEMPTLLKRLHSSILSTATSGQLTKEWRAQRGRDLTSWSQSSVGELVTRVDAGINVQCEERPPTEGERGLVKISAVTWGTYNDSESKTLSQERQVPESTRIKPGDFLISRANTIELVGACVIVHEVTRPVFLSDKILRLVMPDAIKPWILCVLRSAHGRSQIEEFASGNQLSMRNLSQANLRRIAVPLPPADERDEIVRRVQAMLANAHRVQVRHAETLLALGRLSSAFLSKAFRGELVPQDADDEPAGALLARARAERGAPARARGRRASAPA